MSITRAYFIEFFLSSAFQICPKPYNYQPIIKDKWQEERREEKNRT